MKIIKRIVASFIVIQLIIWGLVPLGLIYLSPTPKMPTPTELDFSALQSRTEVVPPELQTYQTRDGSTLNFRDFPTKTHGAPLLVLVHGSGWHSLGYHEMAQRIADTGAAHVITPDLRGHGFTPQRRGDVDYIGQLEDDIADLIKAKRKPAQKVVLAGHSSGGGFVIRFAGGDYGNMLDGAVLLAPFLHHASTINRKNAGNWAFPQVPRIAGLTMQNMIGIHALDGNKVLFFNHPKGILDGPYGKTATKAYSHRLLTSFHPRDDWQSDVAKLPPFLLLVGEDDDAFYADQYERLLSPLTDKGRYEVVPNLDHSTILIDPRPVRSIVHFIEQL